MSSNRFIQILRRLIVLPVAIMMGGCSAVKKSKCFKSYMNGHKFKYVTEKYLNGYFIMNDSVQIEFKDEKLYGKSKVVWLNCKSYFLIVRDVSYNNEGLKPGDTLRIDIHSAKKDTLTYTASAYGQSYFFKVVKSL